MLQVRTIKERHTAVREDIGDLLTYRALPTQSIQHIDPFLFLNHHGPQVYKPSNHGLPFGPHPHRGFETVTIILKGDIAHRDTGGHESVIEAGGVQWMTAGRGLVHEEVSSEAFKRKGGELEILQLWVNLPKRLKMTEPRYIGLQQREIPHIDVQEGRIKLDLLAGSWDGQKGAFEPLTDIALMLLAWNEPAQLQLTVSPDRNIFCYMIRGEAQINEQHYKSRNLVEFESEGELVKIEGQKDALLLFGHAKPYREPIVAHGPFVMNTKAEIFEAIQDYQAGKFG